MRYFDVTLGPGHNALGFGASRGFGWTGLDPFPGHGLRDVLLNTGINTGLLGTELSGWASGSVVALLLVVVLRKVARGDTLMLAAAAAVVAGHAFYWFAGGPDFGPRYWFLVLVPCVALVARGLLALDAGDPPRATLAGLALTLSALAVFVPWRAADKYHDYRLMRPDVRDLARTHAWDGALVLVQGNRHPDYASAAAYLPVPLDAGGAVYAWDKDAAARRAALDAFPGRPVWIVAGPTRTGGAFRVVAGPLAGAARDSIR
jgi:hypothetical protein